MDPVIDTVALDRLRRDMGADADLLLVLFDAYMGQLPGRVDAINGAARDDDRPALELSAHGLLSPSVTLGLSQVAKATAELEDRALVAGIAELDRLMAALRAAVAQVPAAAAALHVN